MTGWPARYAPLIWLLVSPLIVGIARGEGYLVFRPNEVLLLLLLVGVGFGAVHQLVTGGLKVPPPCRVDGAVIGLVICGTALPILIGIARGTQLGSDDVLYALVFLKYGLLYGLIRLTVQTVADLRRAILAILASAILVALVALLQAKDLLGIQWFLTTFYDDPFEGSTGVSSLRASSTVASSFGLSDMMSIVLGLSVSLVLLKTDMSMRNRVSLLVLIPVFLLAVLAAGSFSGVIGAAIVALVTGVLLKRLKQLLFIGVAMVPIGMLLLWETIAARLQGFSGYRALPRSWLGRWDNLERFFWPDIQSGWNWLIGVRPAARVPAPETWREWVYIESGYTWLIWIGGVPLLLAFFYFVWAVLADLLPLDTRMSPESRALRITAVAATAMIATLMLFDPHLTVRGCADLYFPLLALALCRPQLQQLSGLPAVPVRMRYRYV